MRAALARPRRLPPRRPWAGAGHAAEQLPAAALMYLEAVRAGLDGHRPATSDMGARGQSAVRYRSPVVRRWRHLLSIRPCVWTVGSQVQVREQDLALAQHGRLDGLRFLDLHDHVGAFEDLLGGVDDLGAGLFGISLVRPMV